MQRVEAAQIVAKRESGGVLHQRLVDLDDGERGPLVLCGLGRTRCCGQPDHPDGLDEAEAADVPTVSLRHRVAHDVTALLGDVAPDERARVEVQPQRSASRSESTTEAASLPAAASFGARLGCARAGGTSRPLATSSRRRSSISAATAGTMYATGRREASRAPARRARRRARSHSATASARAHQARACAHL